MDGQTDGRPAYSYNVYVNKSVTKPINHLAAETVLKLDTSFLSADRR